MISALGVAYSITNTGLGILLAIGTAVYFGGPPSYFWGFLLMTIVGFCAAVSLGELVSMYPHSGGQYFWVAQLYPAENGRRLLSYITAIFAWAGAVATGASACLVCTQIIFGMATLANPGLTIQPWQIFLGFQALNLACFPVNCVERGLGYFGKLALIMAISSTIVIFIAVLAVAPTKQSAAFFFTDFTNVSGWPTGLAFFIGINAPNWNFSCLDAATHLADELPDPRRNIPRVLVLTVLVGFITGLPVLMAMYFCVQSVDDAINGVSGIFSMEVFLQVFTGNKAAALGLEALVLIPGIFSIVGIHTWQSRMAWALSRDGGFPSSKYLARVASAPFGSPVYAHAWSASWTAMCGFLYLASTTAFSSLISAGIVLQYLSYSLAVGCLLLRGRSNVRPGPFFMPKLGLVCNVVVLIWTVAATVFYSLPYFMPVKAAEMNYVSVVLVFIVLYAFVYWFAVGRRAYVVPPREEDWER